MSDPLAQVLRELQAERLTPMPPDWKDPRRVEGHGGRWALPAWTPEEQAEHRLVAAREDLAYGRAHPSDRPSPKARARQARVHELTAGYRRTAAAS